MLWATLDREDMPPRQRSGKEDPARSRAIWAFRAHVFDEAKELAKARSGPHATSKEILNQVTSIARTYFSKALREDIQEEYIRNPGATKTAMREGINPAIKKLMEQVEKTEVEPASVDGALARLERAKDVAAVAAIQALPVQLKQPIFADEVDPFPTDTLVMLRDLQNAMEFNGKIGRVTGFSAEAGRWSVELPCGTTKNIRACNLEKVALPEELPPVPDDGDDGDVVSGAVPVGVEEGGQQCAPSDRPVDEAEQDNANESAPSDRPVDEAEQDNAHESAGRKKGYEQSSLIWQCKVRAKLVETIEKHTCDNMDIAKLLSSVAKKMGAQKELQTVVNTTRDSYNAEMLFEGLGAARNELKHHPAGLVNILDAAVAPACTNHDILSSRGYVMPRKTFGKLKKRGRGKKVPGVKKAIGKVGQPNKLDDPKVLAIVEKELRANSQGSSWLGVVPGRKKDQAREMVKVRVLSALLSTIYLASATVRAVVKITTFRRICAKHFRHYRRARVKTDLCDHCEKYRLKVVPRLREACAEWATNLNDVCKDYWKAFQEAPQYKTLKESQDHLANLDAMEDYIIMHVQKNEDHRKQQEFPAKITHVEGTVLKQLRLHRKIIASYEWHMLAAAKENKQARLGAESPKPNEATGLGDFMEKVGIPQAHCQTYDMFHGSQRKTLSVFGFYIAQTDADGRVEKTGVILVSDVVETTACYANVCVEQAVPYVKRLGELAVLKLRFDTGNHFRSYESLACFCWSIPHKYNQRTQPSYRVEKHGKSECDSELFSPCRRWLNEALAAPKALIESEHDLVQAYRKGAEKDMLANPTGIKFIIELVNVPEAKPLTAKVLKFRGSTVEVTHVNRSYCWEAVPDHRYACGIRLYNHVFTNMPVTANTIQPTMTLEDKSLARKKPSKKKPSKGDKKEEADSDSDAACVKPGVWRRGYWQNCTWRSSGPRPGEATEITRTYDDQTFILRKSFLGRRKITVFEDEVAKAEARLNKAASRMRRKAETLSSLPLSSSSDTESDD